MGSILLSCCSKTILTEIDGTSGDQIIRREFKELKNGSADVLRTLKSSPYETFDGATYNYFTLLDSLLIDTLFYNYLISEDLFQNSTEIPLSNILKLYNNFLGEIVYDEGYLFQVDNDSALLLNEEQYFPCINVANLNHLNPDYNPIVAFGLDLESIDDSISDIIYGRYHNSTGDLLEIEINEINGMTSSIPVLIMTVDLNDELELENVCISNSLLFNDTLYNKLKVFWYPTIDDYSIIHLFDRSNRAEYTEVHTNWYLYFEEFECDDRLVKKIHKNELGKTHHDDHQLARDLYPDGIFLITYEYDWFSIGKLIAVCNYNVGCWVFRVKMTKTHEWYQKQYFEMPQSSNNSITLTDKEGHCKILTND